MRTAVERATIPAAALVVVFCALFFSGAQSLGPLVWIGGIAVLVAALAGAAIAAGALGEPRLDWPALGFLGCLAGLAVWMGLSIIWSTQPSHSWQYTNRTVAYLGFACLGIVLGALQPGVERRLAGTLALLLGLVAGWALLTKAVPTLYEDYGRVARLRAPIGYWNELAVLADVAVPLALWVAAGRRRPGIRVAGVVLLYTVVLALLLTYSRYGIVLGAVVAALWVLLDRERVASLAALVLGAGAAAGVFGYALSLPGITSDGQTHAQRVHDGWRFALVTIVAAIVVAGAALLLARRAELKDVSAAVVSTVERAAVGLGLAGVVAALVVAGVFHNRIWHDFTASVQVTNASGHLQSLSSSNRWTWWQQAWHAFTHHPGGGTGAGTFNLTNRLARTSPYDVAVEPHNVPLQLLSETGIVGLLLFAAMVVALARGVLVARARTREPAVTALGLGLAAWLLHMVGDMDWNYVAVSGPLLLSGAALLASPAGQTLPRRRPLLAIGSVALALAAAYSLAAPWLAEQKVNAATSASSVAAAVDDLKTAHSFDPLSTEVLLEWAAFVDVSGDADAAHRLYLDAVSREPLNPDAWYELGAFEYRHRQWQPAYRALDRSWGLDRQGPAGVRCDYLDLVRRRLGIRYGVSCRGFRQPARP